MTGHLLLEGGAEFGGKMSEPDLRALELAGGLEVAVCIIPTAAAPDHNDRRAGQNGVRWFKSLGAGNVVSVPLVDRASADDPVIIEAIRNAGLIYLLGGFPGYLGQTLSGSGAWQAMMEAYRNGAVLGGSSAGAMVLAAHYYDPETRQVMEGLKLLPGTCILPHHNNFGKRWAGELKAAIPGVTLIGIDEQTGMIDGDPGGRWRVYGKGCITIYADGQERRYAAGEGGVKIE